MTHRPYPDSKRDLHPPVIREELFFTQFTCSQEDCNAQWYILDFSEKIYNLGAIYCPKCGRWMRLEK